MNKLLIGWAEENITPDKKIKLAGQFFERISQYVETPISVTAMAVESGTEQMIICSCDLGGIGENLIKLVRERLKDNVVGLDVNKIIINATHTHTAMLYNGKGAASSESSLDVLKRYLSEDKEYVEKVSSDDVMNPQEALVFLAEKITIAIKKAWESRKNSYYANEFGRVAVGMCRRVVYDDKTAKMWGDTNSANFDELEGGNDSGIELLYVFDDNKKLAGVVANVACPSQVVEHRSFISSDYWGKVRILLRKKFGDGLFVLGLCSAAGDQCPRDMIRWVNPETPIDDPNIKRENYIERNADPSMFDIKGTWKVGKRIANEIIDVYDEAMEHICGEAELIHKVTTIDMPIRRVAITEYNEAVKAIEDYIKNKDNFDFADNAGMHIFAGTIARYEYQQNHDICPIEVHVVRFGDVVFTTNPFELFLNYGNQIRARSKAKQTFIIQLACGSNSYLPTKKAEEGSHYSAYVSSGITGHQGGELLVRKTVQEINQMWE